MMNTFAACDCSTQIAMENVYIKLNTIQGMKKYKQYVINMRQKMCRTSGVGR